MRRLTTSLIALALALSLNVVALGLNVSPAAAHSTCSTGYFCVWPLGNYSDYWPIEEHIHFSGNDTDWDLTGLENDDDSVKNRESYRVLVYAGWNYTEGYTYCTQPGEDEDDINFAVDDNGDSNKLGSVTSCGTLQRP
jgi:hypothetical protein